MQQLETLEDVLKTYFQYNSFRTGQKEIIKDVLSGNDVLGILPTGSGKSICYQLPAKIQNGLTIVVSPLISLMIDQVKQLKAMNFKEVVAINSFMDPREKRMVYDHIDQYKLIYVSPELLQQQELISCLKRNGVRLFVIDEAHCISQWGPEFRPDYLKLGEIIKELNDPTVMALSATATPEVQSDIVHILDKPEMKQHIYPMDKDNISFCIEEAANDGEKIERIIELCKTYPIPILIYFTSRAYAEQTAVILTNRLPDRNIAFYHGGMEQIDRISIQQQFMNDQLDIICCTNAFGMGINKSNIRLIIHYHLPLQLESYIQEIGRAGRDGKSSVGLILFSEKDAYLPSHMIKNELPDENDLPNIFHRLYRFVKQEVDIVEMNTNENMEALLDLSETQWKFLRYQLEKHGIIKNNRIFYQESVWQDTLKVLQEMVKKRIRHKQGKLNEIINWVNEDNCLREQLYKPFQSTYKDAKYQCCSNCGFHWSEWEPEETNVNTKLFSDWESNLKYVLMVEDENETKRDN